MGRLAVAGENGESRIKCKICKVWGTWVGAGYQGHDAFIQNTSQVQYFYSSFTGMLDHFSFGITNIKGSSSTWYGWIRG